MVDTRFWSDDYVANLDPSEKLVFLYFLTNPYTEICGAYEIPLKTVAVDTGLDKEMIVKIVNRFERDGKMVYHSGWIGIINFVRYQQKNPKVELGIQRGLNQAPESLLKRMEKSKENSITPQNSESRDTLSYLTKLNLTKLNLSDSGEVPPPKQERRRFTELGAAVIKAFEGVDPKNKNYYANVTQRRAADFLVEEYGMENVLAVIGVLSETNKLPYFPTITNAYELQERWVKLGDAYEKDKNLKKGKVAERLKDVIW